MVLLSTQQARTAQPRLAATNVLRRACACGQHTWGGECPACRQKKGPTLQRAAVRTDSAAAGAVPPIVHEVLQSPGQPLDPETRTFMEPRFGQDLSRVRVHANARAAESAWAVNARAYTVGNAIVFGAGFYAPQNPDGRRLLAHELSHVVQQRPGSSTPAGPIALGAADSSTEREADSLADRVTGHHHGPEREPTTHVRTETASRGVATLQRDFFSSSSSADGGADAGVDAGTVGGTDAGTDAGSAASCKVDVRATHIGGILSGLPIWHLFVVYTDTSGTEYFFRGGPGGSCSGVAAGTYGTIISTRGPYVPGTVDWDASAPTVTVASGSGACGKDSCFTSELARIDGTCTPYSPTGPNSNTVARTLLTKCGTTVDKPVSIAPGFGTTL